MAQRPRTNEQGQRVVRVQSGRSDGSGPYDLAVPAHLARLIGPDAEFVVELTRDGLLYRKVSGEPAAKSLPPWLTT